MNKPTSRDVAELAGVSQSTVSLILNNKENVSFSEETVEKVLSAAKELNYELPNNRISKNYNYNNDNLILLFSPTMNNPYYPLLTQAIEKNASNEGFNILLVNTHRNQEIEKMNLESLTEKNSISGIIYEFSPSFPDLVEQLAEDLPIVIVGEKDDNVNIDTIGLSSYKAGKLVAEHLIELGHENIAYISSPIDRTSLSRKKRLEGIKDTLKAHGLLDNLVIKIDKNEHEIINNIYEIEVGYNLTKEILKENGITAIIGVNDLTASGIMNALHSEGYNVPEDISVCGFDNVYLSTILHPSLTTIDHSIEHRGKISVDVLLEKSADQNKRKNPQKQILNPALSSGNTFKIEYDPQLIVRNSTGKRK